MSLRKNSTDNLRLEGSSSFLTTCPKKEQPAKQCAKQHAFLVNVKIDIEWLRWLRPACSQRVHNGKPHCARHTIPHGVHFVGPDSEIACFWQAGIKRNTSKPSRINARSSPRSARELTRHEIVLISCTNRGGFYFLVVFRRVASHPNEFLTTSFPQLLECQENAMPACCQDNRK